MSRLIVKNLPAHLDDARLKAHFSSQGHVTDVRLIRRPDGTSRRFAFVGYSSEDDARTAVDYFNRTFIDTSRIQVDLAKKIDDPELKDEMERKRGSAFSSREGFSVPPSGPGRPGRDAVTAGTLPPPRKKAKTSASSSSDPSKSGTAATREVTFDEFFAALAPKSKRKTRQDINADAIDPDSNITGAETKSKKKKKDKAAASTEVAQKQRSDGAEEDKAGGEDCDGSDRDEALDDEGLTDMDYLARRMKRRIGGEDGLSDDDSSAKKGKKGVTFEQSDDEDNDDDDDDASSVTTDPEVERTRHALAERARKDEENVDLLMTSCRIFVRNLPFSASSDDIENTFGKFGEVSQVHIPLDRETKAPKGMAYVSFADPAHAVAAFRALDGSTFQGRLLHLIPAIEKTGAGGVVTGAADGQAGAKPQKSATLKQSALKERRALAGKDFNWSTLYMNPDAVATSVADRLGISKSDILNPDAAPDGDASKGGSSAAVRLALAETRVIQETKEFLVAHGISLDSFDSKKKAGTVTTNKKQSAPVERSETTMLVKNIPYGTTADEIRSLFTRHGEVSQVLLPPAGTLAIVQMLVPGEARVAFRALAYRRFKDSVLYLEKAPSDLFVGGGDGPSPTTAVQSAIKGKDAPASKTALKLGGDVSEAATTSQPGAQANGENGDASSTSAPPGASLFVKNLNFSTTDAGLTTAFAAFPDFAFARVQTKPAPVAAANTSSRKDSQSSVTRPDGRLSMGFGFAVFKSAEAAQRAQKAMDGFLLDGHTLNVKFAKRGHDADDAGTSGSKKTASSATSTKLMIKNLPFETAKKDVRELFAAHGQVRSVRLPKRIDNRPRGFGFVEFVSHREAEAAMESLRHTRLLGRHLVIGWAEDEAGGGAGGGGAAGLGSDADAVERQRAKEAAALGMLEADGSLMGKKSKMRMNEGDIADAVAAEKRKRAEDDDDDDEE
ncbi:unnamed protein product [Tilletia controversa]|uniref:Multiple RNA-binding domain-containing protein 1 n=1 Tax=Tilletia controversa TaxID=13291 RepID=A0A8X7MY28_9BASI|nr:hypothetical protein CF328_g1440 [Tilletia controversa]KAE8253218.1 hypothetical protein A4X06_0g1613 [Tilletia controversa]CAD6911056.1 unnamed protein product [Tilletia controversa]CAD6923070.1 unnamed protein product [Tilletia controversa]CAD6923948.1 unnamed protein product [Tilletia controversa]